MKKTIKLLSVLLGIILALTSILSLTVSADDAANGQSSTYNQSYNLAQKSLMITEINGADADNNAYQYIEITNISNANVLLNDYYMYRWGANNTKDQWDRLGLRQLLGIDDATTALARISFDKYLTEDVTIAPGEVVVVWLNMTALDPHGTHGGVKIGGNAVTKGAVTVDMFRAYWSIDANIKVANLQVSDSLLYAFHFSHPQPGTSHTYCKYNTGLLPLAPGDCIIQLTHKDAQMQLTSGTITPATDTEDFVFMYNNGGTPNGAVPNGASVLCYKENAIARHKAADCSALWFTDSNYESATNTTTPIEDKSGLSQHFYGFMDMDRYEKAASALVEGTNNQYVTTESVLAAITNFVTGKATETGEYAVGNGLIGYQDKGDTSAGWLYFADEGTKTTPTPCKLNAGQFGYGTSVQAFGKQVKTEGNTYSVRFTASLEADALLAAKKVGFDIVAKYTLADGTTTGTKTISKDCTTVYASIYGKGENGAETYTKADLTNGHEYFYSITVENISIEKYENIIFEVTPYIINQSGAKISAATATATYDDGAVVENA